MESNTLDYFKDINAEFFINYLENHANREEIMSNFVKVTLYYQSQSVTTTTQIKVYSSVNLLSNAGGLMGLCMGLSIVSLFELFAYFCNILNLILFQRKEVKNKVQS